MGVFKNISHILKLLRAGRVLSRYDALIPQGQKEALPLPAKLGLALLKFPGAKSGITADQGDRLARALTDLGPTYIKLGQFLATRPDLVGNDISSALAKLQDRLPAFSQAEARREIESQLGHPIETLYADFSEAVAAASIAQVHKAHLPPLKGKKKGKAVAVKILRPSIEKKFQADMDTFFFSAKMMEALHAPSRRLKPLDAVQTLANSVDLEMDLRMEAAAISEMRDNISNDPGFLVPNINWERTSKRVLTIDWVDGIPLNDIKALQKAGHDLPKLGEQVIQSFLRHAMRDGFFHADMHQGNLFADKDGNLVAVDFGIMGRLSPKDRRFLAEILHGFITKNYQRVAEVHYEAGYVPDKHPVESFAQALRAIGEPLLDQNAEDISMGHLLAQLFLVTDQFDMETQPQLLLLQKTMIVVEGVARTLNPQLNMWEVAEPVVREWMESKLSPEGRLAEAASGAMALGKIMSGLPDLLSDLENSQHVIKLLDGVLHNNHNQKSTEHFIPAKSSLSLRIAAWIAAFSLALIALSMLT